MGLRLQVGKLLGQAVTHWKIAVWALVINFVIIPLVFVGYLLTIASSIPDDPELVAHLPFDGTVFDGDRHVELLFGEIAVAADPPTSRCVADTGGIRVPEGNDLHPCLARTRRRGLSPRLAVASGAAATDLQERDRHDPTTHNPHGPSLIALSAPENPRHRTLARLPPSSRFRRRLQRVAVALRLFVAGTRRSHATVAVP